MQKNLKDFKGKDAIFIDGNIFLHHAFDINPISVEFLKNIESLNIKAYTSALVLEEVTFKLIMQSASNILDRVTVQSVKALLFDDKKRLEVFKPVMEYMKYISMLKESGLGIIDLTYGDMIAAVQKGRTYGLITADSAHIAVMERKGITNIATSDSDFNVVSGITLWSPV
jgi:predicted nucleic acid-binding protein